MALTHLLPLFLLACGGTDPAPTQPPAPAAATPELAKAPVSPSGVPRPATPLAGDIATRSPAPDVAAARALLGAGKADEAAAALDKVRAERPADADAAFWRARVHESKKELEPALAAYQSAMASDPTFTAALRGQGDVLAAMRNCEAAAPILDELTVRWPEDASVWFNRGHCRYVNRDFAGALVDSRKACEMGMEPACRVLSMMERRIEVAGPAPGVDPLTGDGRIAPIDGKLKKPTEEP